MLIGIDGNEANLTNRVGIGQFAFGVISALEKIDKDNSYLIYLKNAPLFDMPKERGGWKYLVFGPQKLWTQIALPLKLFFQREKPNVFYSPSHYGPRFSPVPNVISIMDLWHHCHPEQFNKKDLYQLKSWEAYSVRKANRIVTISEFSKSEIIKFYNYPADRITVAYPGIQDSGFRIQNSETKKIKRKYNIEGDYLLYLGTLQPKKNIEGLIEAFNLVSKGFPNLYLVIAGKKGWLYEKIFAKVRQSSLDKKVIFTGFVGDEDKCPLIAGAKAFVMPSFYEGFGIPVLEALACGTLVISSNAGSLPETGGKVASYFDPSDTDSMAKAIKKTLNLKAKEKDEIIKNGQARAKEFSWEKCAKIVLETLKFSASN